MDSGTASTASFAVSVASNANVWYLDQNNVMPYISSYSETVSGVQKLLYQPNAISLPDVAANSATFPTETKSTSNVNASGTTGTITIPAGVGYGELILALIGVAGNPTFTPPTGWTTLFGGSQGANETLVVLYKIATGAEGTSASFTLGTASTSSCQCYLITNYSGVPVVGVGAAGSATTNPAPSSLTSGFGVVDTLWIPVACDSVTMSAVPSGYTTNGVTGTTPYLSSAYLQSQAASVSPGTFTAASGNWVANTIGIQTALPIILVDQDATQNAAITLGYNPYISISYGATVSYVTNGSVSSGGSALSGFTPNSAPMPPHLLNNGNNLPTYGDNSTIWGVVKSFMGSVQSAGQMPQQSQ